MRAVFLFILILSVVTALIAWIWWWSRSPNPEAPLLPLLSADEQKKRDGVVVFSMYLGFLALVELDAQQRWNDRYRRCDPEPYSWYPLERVLQLLKYHMRSIVDALMNLFINLPPLLNPLDWFRLFSDDTIRNIASAVASPYLAGFQIVIDILAEIVLGKPVYVPLSNPPMCYVYCYALNDDYDVCEYN